MALMTHRTTRNHWLDFLAGAPAELLEMPRWLCWQNSPDNLFSPLDGSRVQAGDRANWANFETALRAADCWSTRRPAPTGAVPDLALPDEDPAMNTNAAPGNPAVASGSFLRDAARQRQAAQPFALAFVLDGSGLLSGELPECVRCDLENARDLNFESYWTIREHWWGAAGIRNIPDKIVQEERTYVEAVPCRGKVFGDMRFFYRGGLSSGTRQRGYLTLTGTGAVPVSGMRLDCRPSWQRSNPPTVSLADLGDLDASTNV